MQAAIPQASICSWAGLQARLEKKLSEQPCWESKARSLYLLGGAGCVRTCVDALGVCGLPSHSSDCD